MAQEVSMDRGAVDAQIQELTALLDLVDTQVGPIQKAQARQSGAWSSIDACQQFGATYAAALGEIQRALQDIRQSISVAMINLRDNASDLANRDEATQFEYAALAKRLGTSAAPPVGGALTVLEKLMGRTTRTPPMLQPATATPVSTGAAPAATPDGGGRLR